MHFSHMLEGKERSLVNETNPIGCTEEPSFLCDEKLPKQKMKTQHQFFLNIHKCITVPAAKIIVLRFFCVILMICSAIIIQS